MHRCYIVALSIAVMACLWTAAPGQEVFRLSFDDIESLNECGTFNKQPKLASPGYKGSGGCVACSDDGIYTTIEFTLPEPVPIREGAKLRFAHRVDTEGRARYVGVQVFVVGGEKVGQGSVPTGPVWRVDEVDLAGMGPTGFAKSREALKVGDRIAKIRLYGRLAESAVQTAYVDDWTLIVPGEKLLTLVPVAAAAKAQESDGLPPPTGDELFCFDFERGKKTDYAGFRGGDIVSPGHRSKHAWQVSGNTKFLNVEFDCSFLLRKKLYLFLDHKVVTQGHPLYIGIYLKRADGRKVLISNVTSNTDWTESASRAFSLFGLDGKSEVRERGKLGERYTKIILYSKLAEAAPQTLLVDNLKLVWEGGEVQRPMLEGACYRVRTPKRIDGKLDDWSDIDASSGLVIGEADHCHRHFWYQGPSDLSALVYAAHDEENIYLAYVVSDDVARSSWQKGDDMHQGDCVLAAFAPACPGAAKPYARVYMFSPGDFGDVSPVMHISKGEAASSAELSAARRDDGYVMEVRIPKRELGFDASEGRAIGFDAMVYDSDEPFGPSSRKTIFTWASYTDRYDATECGRLRMAGLPAEPAAQPVGTAVPSSCVKDSLKEERVFAVRPVQQSISEAGLPVGLLFSRDDLAALRERIKSGVPQRAFEILRTLCDLYLENCRPDAWQLDAIDEDQARLLENYVVRLSLMYLLSEDARYAELARRTALKVARCDAWPENAAARSRLVRALTVGYDWLFNCLTEQEGEAIRRKLAACSVDPTKRKMPLTAIECSEVRGILAEGVSLREVESPLLPGAPSGGIGRASRRLKRVFDHNVPSSMRKELLGRHPRTIVTAGDIQALRQKAAAMPRELWKPSSMKAPKLDPPRRRGNSGRAGYRLPGLCLSYCVTGQDVYAEIAKKIMRRVCEYPHWGGHNHLPADVDLDAGALLFGVGVAYDLLYHQMMPSERRAIRDKLVLQARRMYRRHGKHTTIRYDQNHTYIDNGGLWVTAIALYDEVPEAKEWYEFGTRILKKGMYVLNADDGAFYEGIAYWGYGMGMHFLQFLHIFENVTGEDAFENFTWFRKNKYFLAYTALPGWQYLVPLWDTGHGLKPKAGYLRHWLAMLKAASEYGDSEAQGLAELFHREGRLKPTDNAWALLWWDPSVSAVNPLTRWPPYHYFRDFDQVFVRSSWDDDASYFAMRCGPPLGKKITGVVLRKEIPEWSPGTGHVHTDLNAFFIFHRGEHLASDTAYTVVKKTSDHNTIAVDGGGQIGEGQAWPIFTPWDRYGRIGEFFAAPDDYYYVRGEAAQGYQAALELTKFDRHVMFIVPDCFVILDELASRKPHGYEWICHGVNPPTLLGDGRFVFRSGTERLLGAMLLPVDPDCRTEEAIVEAHPGQEHTARRGHRVRMRLRDEATNARFLTVLMLQQEGHRQPKIELVDGGKALGAIIRREGMTDIVLLQGKAAGVVSNGARCFVRCGDRGDSIQWAIHGGTRLSVRGRVLLSADRPVTCAWNQTQGVGYVTCAGPTSLSVPCLKPPNDVRVDGKARSVRHDPNTGTITVDLRPGRHRIALGDTK